MRFIRSRLTTTPPRIGTAPPVYPVPAPRGTSGVRVSLQSRAIAATSAVVAGNDHGVGGMAALHPVDAVRSRRLLVDPDVLRPDDGAEGDGTVFHSLRASETRAESVEPEASVGPRAVVTLANSVEQESRPPSGRTAISRVSHPSRKTVAASRRV